MSTSPFMDDYSSEDYSDIDIDHDDDFYFVPVATSTQLQVPAQVETHTQNNELQNLIIIDQQVDVSESEEEEGGMVQCVYLAVESYFDLEAQAQAGVAAVLQAQTQTSSVQELTVGSYFDLEAQVETGLTAAIDTKTVLEEGDVIESESLETVEADTAVETVESMIEEFIYEAVESESDLEAEGVVEEPNSYVEHEADAVAPRAETAVEEGDVILESIDEAVESDYDLEAQVETGLPDTETVLEEGDVIESESLETMEADTAVETVEGMIEEFIYEAVESESDLEAEGAIERPNSDVEHEADAFNPEAETAVKEGDVIGVTIDDEAVESDYDLEVVTKAQDMVGEGVVEGEDDMVEEEDDFVEEEDDKIEGEEAAFEEEHDVVEEGDTIDELDSSDSGLTEEEEDDVVVSYLNSPTPTRNKAWKSLVPAWAKLPVTDTITLEDSSLLESFRGCNPMLRFHECGNAVMNVIQTLLCELLRIRNDLRRVLGALFRKRETTKHA